MGAMDYVLAQVNIGRLLAPIDSPYQMFNKLYGRAKDRENLKSVIDTLQADLKKVEAAVGAAKAVSKVKIAWPKMVNSSRRRRPTKSALAASRKANKAAMRK